MKHPSTKTTGLFRLSTLCVLSLCFASCSYSVIVLGTRKGTPEPNLQNDVKGFYAGMKVNNFDSIVPLSVVQNGVELNLPCPSDRLYSLEYKITFGDMLRNTFTFGKRKGIKVKYVCVKESND